MPILSPHMPRLLVGCLQPGSRRQGWGEERCGGTQPLTAPYFIGSNTSLPSSRVRVLETGLGLHEPEALYPVPPEEQSSGCLRTSSPSPRCPGSCRVSIFPHPGTVARKSLTQGPPWWSRGWGSALPLHGRKKREASLGSTALPKNLFIIFTSIANSEKAAEAQPQTSSLLQNVRTRGCLGLPVPWGRET